jgi:hypothetical protein
LVIDIKEYPALAKGTVAQYVIGHPDFVLGIGVCHIQGSLIGGEGYAIGSGLIAYQQFQFTFGTEPIDAIEIQLSRRVIFQSRQAIGRVGKIQPAI